MSDIALVSARPTRSPTRARCRMTDGRAPSTGTTFPIGSGQLIHEETERVTTGIDHHTNTVLRLMLDKSGSLADRHVNSGDEVGRGAGVNHHLSLEDGQPSSGGGLHGLPPERTVVSSVTFSGRSTGGGLR